MFCKLTVLNIDSLTDKSEKKNGKIIIARLWNKCKRDRKDVYLKLKKEGYNFANLISPNAIINGKIIGDNCWIDDLAIIGFGATIHHNIIIKSKVLIGTNTNINDHCFIAASSTIGGGCNINDQTFIGLNAVILDQVNIGRLCIIGAGTIIKRNVENFSNIKSLTSNENIKIFTEETIEEKLMFEKNKR